MGGFLFVGKHAEENYRVVLLVRLVVYMGSSLCHGPARHLDNHGQGERASALKQDHRDCCQQGDYNKALRSEGADASDYGSDLVLIHLLSSFSGTIGILPDNLAMTRPSTKSGSFTKCRQTSSRLTFSLVNPLSKRSRSSNFISPPPY
jgi:hypothetical protein